MRGRLLDSRVPAGVLDEVSNRLEARGKGRTLEFPPQGVGPGAVRGRCRSASIFVRSRGSSTGFVSKLSADGTHLIYSTYLGGSGDELPSIFERSLAIS